MSPIRFTALILALFGTVDYLNASPLTNLGIAGGEKVHASEAHFVAWVRGCTGSLISKNYILTAAHCVDKIKQFNIYLGVQSIFDFDKTKTYAPAEIKIHPNYTPVPSITHDVALVRLNESVSVGDKISIATLPGKSETNVKYDYLRAYGWGLKSDTEASSDLRTVRLTVTDCYDPTDETLICTSRDKGYSLCQGDSGGPLTRAGDTVVGVASRSGCGYSATQKTIFMRVDKYLEWIEKESDAIVPS